MKTIEHYYIVLRRKIIRPILKHEKLAHYISKHCLKTYLAMFYENWVGKRMHYHHPRDLNQALIKLSYENSKNKNMQVLISTCTDKYAVREYIASKDYADTLNELYGVFDNVDDIDFDALPKQFVMKMNNASGRNYICRDKSQCDWQNVKAQFTEWLKDHDYAWWTGEWQYQYIEPKIVVEKYLEDLGDTSLIDYKMQVCNGKVFDFFICYNRDNSLTVEGDRTVCYDCYDADWNRTEDISARWHKQRRMIPKPTTFERMKKMAEDCCQGITYCRFDVYEIDGKIVFGEMTFTPHGNVMNYYTDEYLTRNKDLLKA